MPRSYKRTEAMLQEHLNMAEMERCCERVIISLEDLYALVELASKAPVYEVKDYITSQRGLLTPTSN